MLNDSVTFTPSMREVVVCHLLKRDLDVHLERGASLGQVVKLLLENERSSRLVVAMGNDIDWARGALASGVDVNVMDTDGDCPLNVAATNGRDAIVEFLLNQGSHINNQELYFGWTPLMGASLKGHLSTVKLLVDRGANIHLRSKKGETALDLATARKKTEVAQFLSSIEKRENKPNKSTVFA